MIDSLRGEIAEKSLAHAVVECHGVGYLVHVAQTTCAALPLRGPCKLFVHYAVSMDVRSGVSEHRLFGFLDREERHFFRQLIEVQGVSSTIGMAIMGARPAAELQAAIMQGDESALKSVKGIGPKLAQRIVQELRGKLSGGAAYVPTATGGPLAGNTPRSEALSALTSLGLDRAKAERALQKVMDAHKDDMPPVEELIRLTLKNS